MHLPHPPSLLSPVRGVSNGVLETNNGVNPTSLPLVICLYRCIPVHSIPAEQPPSPHLSLTHTHSPCTVTCQQGSGGCRTLLFSLQEKGCDSARGRPSHPPNRTGTHTCTPTHMHTDRQAHVLTYSHLPRTGGVATCCIIQETTMALGNQVSLQCQRRAVQLYHCWS